MIQVYTGKGKGKTTAALGLALRATGAHLKVYICQFLKARSSAELTAVKTIKNITVERFGTRKFTGRHPSARQIAVARKGLAACRRAILSKRYSMVIMDEINVALSLKLLTLDELLSLVSKTPKEIELVLTGRDCHPRIIERADLVSEIRERKHYFKQGIRARKGIEY